MRFASTLRLDQYGAAMNLWHIPSWPGRAIRFVKKEPDAKNIHGRIVWSLGATRGSRAGGGQFGAYVFSRFRRKVELT